MKNKWQQVSCTGKEIVISMCISFTILLVTSIIIYFSYIPSFNNSVLKVLYVFIITLLNRASPFCLFVSVLTYFWGLYLDMDYRKQGLSNKAVLSDIFVSLSDDDNEQQK